MGLQLNLIVWTKIWSLPRSHSKVPRSQDEQEFRNKGIIQPITAQDEIRNLKCDVQGQSRNVPGSRGRGSRRC